MIPSRFKNQKAAKNAIRDYLAKYPDFGELDAQLELVRFTKFLSEQLLVRVEANDCYFIDMLEDLTRMD